MVIFQVSRGFLHFPSLLPNTIFGYKWHECFDWLDSIPVTEQMKKTKKKHWAEPAINHYGFNAPHPYFIYHPASFKPALWWDWSHGTGPTLVLWLCYLCYDLLIESNKLAFFQQQQQLWATRGRSDNVCWTGAYTLQPTINIYANTNGSLLETKVTMKN